MDDMPSRELVKKMKTRCGFIQYGWEMAMLPVNVHFVGAQSLQKTQGVVFFRSLVRIRGVQTGSELQMDTTFPEQPGGSVGEIHHFVRPFRRRYSWQTEIFFGVHVRFLVVSVSNKACEWRFTKN
jgi:hypothetical protein